jgi:hypothetical protein
MPVSPGTEAVLLRDESLGVTTETKARKVQHNGSHDTYRVSLKRDWLEQLNIAEQGEATLHSLSMAKMPVLVQNPAIIVQPAWVLGDSDD